MPITNNFFYRSFSTHSQITINQHFSSDEIKAQPFQKTYIKQSIAKSDELILLISPYRFLRQRRASKFHRREGPQPRALAIYYHSE